MRKKITVNNIGAYFLLGVFVMLGCQEPEEGCLDLDAVNYDVSADQNCCCTYPTLTFEVLHVLGRLDSALTSNKLIITDRHDALTVNTLQFYISNIEFVDDQGSVVGIDDDITFSYDSGSGIEESEDVDDVILIEFGRLQFNAGTFNHPSTFTQLNFQLGLDPPWKTADADDLRANHPVPDKDLIDSTTALLNDAHLRLRADTSMDASMDVYWNSGATITINGLFEIPRGSNIIFTIGVDYVELLEGIDFISDDKSTIDAKLRTNFPRSIIVE